MLATPLAQLSKKTDSPMRFQAVSKAEKQQFAQLGQEVQKSRDARQTLESKTVDRSAGKPGQALEPGIVKSPQAPTVGKSADQLGKEQVPPNQRKVSESDSKVGPALGASTPATNVRTNKPQPESSKPASKEQPVPTSAESRDARQTLESKTVDRSDGKPAQVLEPTVVKLPRSPIVGKSADQLGKGQAPPDKHKVPEPDLKVEPKPKVFTPAPNPRREPAKAAQERPAAEQPAKREAPPAAQ
jgi:hypothetical protein